MRVLRALAVCLAMLYVCGSCFSSPLEIIPPPPIHDARQQVVSSPAQAVLEEIDSDGEIEDKRFFTDIRFWSASLYGKTDSRGIDLDIKDDTEIGMQNKLGLSSSWKFNNYSLFQFDYFQFDHSGLTSRTLTFDNLTYNQGAKLRWRNSLFGLGYAHTIYDEFRESVKLLCGLRFSQLRMNIERDYIFGSRFGELNQKSTMPYLGLEWSKNVSATVALDASIKGFDLKKNGEHSRHTDADVSLKFGTDSSIGFARQKWYAMLGYRYFMLHDDADGNSSKTVYAGPYVSIRGAF